MACLRQILTVLCCLRFFSGRAGAEDARIVVTSLFRYVVCSANRV